MSFNTPNILWLLLGIIPLLAFIWWSDRRARRTLSAIIGGGARESFFNAVYVKQFLQAFFFLTASAGLLLALADPHWGEITIEDDRAGTDIVFVMDVSNSMLAQDVPPSRLQRSAEVARAAASRIEESAVAVVAFRGDASLVVPMTEDPVGFEVAISNLSPALLSTSGTDIAAGLALALRAFPGGTARHRIVVVFSDGEDLQGNTREALRTLRNAGVPILSVLAGTAAGATIPLPNGDVLRDPAGNPVVTRANEALLRELAIQSGGTLFQLNDPTVTQRLIETVGTLSGRARGAAFRSIPNARFRLFLLLSIAAMAAGLAVQVYPWRDRV